MFPSYYSTLFPDLWLDDWITNIYKNNERHVILRTVKIFHHVVPLRYSVSKSQYKLLARQVEIDSQKIKHFITLDQMNKQRQAHSLWNQSFERGHFFLPEDFRQSILHEKPRDHARFSVVMEIARNMHSPDMETQWLEYVQKEMVFWETRRIVDALIGSNGDVKECTTSQVSLGMGCNIGLAHTPGLDKECPNVPYFNNTVCIMSNRWGEHYYHTFIAGITRMIFLILENKFKVTETTLVHVSSTSPPYVQSLLQIIGFTKLVMGDIRASEALLPPSVPCGGHSYSAYNTMARKFIWAKLPMKAPKSQPVLIVVNRRDKTRST
jgi:hypothetical protein